MPRCWEQRGCDEEMQADCPHPTQFMDNCPTKCAFATCDRPQHVTTIDAELIFNPEIDRKRSVKDECHYCGFFLTRGPRIDGSVPDEGESEPAE